jgi:hypothetical protein
MRPKYEFLWQKIAGHFLLHGKTAPKAFTESVVKMWSVTALPAEADLFSLWVRASEQRKDFDSSMAYTIWQQLRKCDWPGCTSDSKTVPKPCDVCDPNAIKIYHACAPCSKIGALEGVWPESRLVKLNPDSSREPMTVCPVCTVAYVTRIRHVAADVSELRLEWPVLAARNDKGGRKDCITCAVGFGCIAHEEKQFWSKAPGEYKIVDLGGNQQQWFAAQHQVIGRIFANLSTRSYLAEAQEKLRTAREIEIKLALGCTDLAAMEKQLDPSQPARVPAPTLAPGKVPTRQQTETALQTKLAYYDKMLHDATPSGRFRPIRIEHTSWQNWWETAKTDDSEKGKRSFLYFDPMYDDMPTASEFDLMRLMMNYVSTPGAIGLIFHSFLNLATYAGELCKPSAKKGVLLLTLFESYLILSPIT